MPARNPSADPATRGSSLTSQQFSRLRALAAPEHQYLSVTMFARLRRKGSTDKTKPAAVRARITYAFMVNRASSFIFRPVYAALSGGQYT
jgi:hypothetical protein